MTKDLGDQGRSRGRVVLPDGREHTRLLVVARQAVDARLDQNHAVLGVLVLAVALQMLADSDGLLDQVVQILGDFGSKTYKYEDAYQQSPLGT